MNDQDTVGDMWIKTMPIQGGAAYKVTMEVEGHTIDITTEMAFRYTWNLLSLIARVEYDAAVYLQIVDTVKKGESLREARQYAAHMVKEMRDRRTDIDWSFLHPVSHQGIVNKTGEPHVVLVVDGKGMGMLDTASARGHALAVLEAVEVADLDQDYHALLTQIVGVEPDSALCAIGELGKYRPNDQSTTVFPDDEPQSSSKPNPFVKPT